MPSPKQTTVVLSESVQALKDELAPIYGLKNILSAGLLLFSRLSDTEQKKILGYVHNLAKADQEAAELVSAAEADAAKHKQRRGRKPSKAG